MPVAPADPAANGVTAALHLLPSGRLPSDPAAVLAAGQFESVVHELLERFDVVIVDTSPLLAVSDALPLLTQVDAVVLVARLFLTRRSVVKQLNELLLRTPDTNVVGVVANGVRRSPGAYAYPYGYAST